MTRSALFLCRLLTIGSYVHSLHAQPVPLVFDNQAGFDTSQVFVHFLTGDDTPITGHYFDLNGTAQILQRSTPYSLAQISGPAAQGTIPGGSPAVFLENFSGRVYLSLGTSGLILPTTGYSPAAATPTDPNYLTRYQYVEPTIKNGVFEGDLSYIDFAAISFSLKAASFNPVQVTNNPQTSQNAYLLINAVKATVAPGKSAVLPDTVTNLNNPVADPNFTRVIGPNIDATPFNTFENYIDAMNGQTVKIGGIFVGTGPQNASTLPEKRLQTYDFKATFSGTVASGGSVTLTALPNSGNGEPTFIPNFTPTGPGVGNQVTLTIKYSDLNAVTGIYGNNPPYSIVNTALGQNITTTGLTNDVYGRVVGDLLAGFSLGYLGSTVTLTPGGTPIGQMTSVEWWGNGPGSSIPAFLPDGTPVNNNTTPAAKGIYFRSAQPTVADPTKPRYHQYADALIGADPSHPLTPGYGFPLQDRLGANLITLDLNASGGNPNAYMTVVINPDLGQPLNTAIWDGGAGTGLWATAANWNPDTVPTSGAIIQFAGSNQTTVTVGDSRTIGGIFFNLGASPFTIGSAPNENTLLLSGNIANSSGALQTVNSAITFTGTRSILTAVDGNLTLAGNLNLSTADIILTGNTGRTVTLSGDISGSGSLTKTGLASLILSGAANTFSGGFTLHGGTATISNSNALGTGTITLGAGELRATGGPVTLTNSLILTGTTSSTIGFGGTQPFTFSGPITLQGSSTIRNTVDLTWNGILGATGSGSSSYILTKTGTGNLTLGGTAANTFAGTIQVNRGLLELNQSTGPAISGSLIIGDGTSATPSATAKLLASGQFPTTQPHASISINTNGQFDTQTFDATLNRLNLSGGSILGTGTLTFAENPPPPLPAVQDPILPIILFNGTGSAASTISANLQLTDNTSFNVFATNAPVELTVSGNISGAGGLTKNEGGTLALTGDNSGITGNVTVAGGTLASTSLANANLAINGGSLSPGGTGTITDITINNLTLNSGGLLYDLAAATTDRVIVTTAILGSSPKATFSFLDDGFLTTPANTPVSFTLLTTTVASEISKLSLTDLFFSSVNIAGLTGTFSLDAVNGHLLFEARHGVTAEWSTTAASGLWGTGTNWVGGDVPLTGADLTFTTSSSTSLTLQADRQTGSITINAGGDAFSFNGNNLILGGNFTNNATATQTINSGLILNGNRTISTVGSGVILVQGDLALSNSSLPSTLTLAGAGTITINGVISDAISSILNPSSGNLIISGPGMVQLAGANTFTGTVTLQGGTLEISSDGNLGSSGLTSVRPSNSLNFDGGTLRFTAPVTLGLVRNITFTSQGILDTNGHDVTVQGTLSGSGGFQKLGGGTLTLASSTSQSTYSGSIQILNGTLSASVVGSFGQTSAITVSSGATLQLTSNITLTQPSLALNGAGAGGVGALNITSGIVSITTTTSLTGNATVSAQNATTLTLAAIQTNGHTLTLAPANNSVTLTLGGPISGAGGLTLASPSTGIVAMTGTNTYTGATTLTGGTLILNNTANLKNAPGSIAVGSGASLQLANLPINSTDTGINLNNAITLNGSGAGSQGALLNTVGQNILSGAITLAGPTSINIQGGTLTLSGAISGANNLTLTAGNLTLSGNNSAWSGDLTIDAGSTVVATGVNAMGAGTTNVANGASLRIAGGIDLTSAGINLSGPGVGGNTGALQSVLGNNTYTGPITVGPGSTINVGSGNLTLSGTTAFGINGLAVTAAPTSTVHFGGPLTSTTSAGNLQIVSGTVSLGSANPGFLGSVNVQSGATLVTLNANPLDSGTLLLPQGSTLSPGGVGTLQTLNLSTIGQIDGILYFDLGPGTNSDQIALATGAPSFGPNASFFFNDAGYNGPGVYTLTTSPGAPVGFSTLTFQTNIQGLTGTFSVSSTDLLFTASGGGSMAATWDGGAGSGLWADANNWDPNGLPDVGADLTFAGAVQPIIDTGVTRVTGDLTFDPTATNFVINNNFLSVNGNITNNSTNLQTLNSTVIVNNDRTFNAAAGVLTFGAIQINPATAVPHTLTLSGAHDIIVSGPMTNQGSASGNVLINNTATVTFSGTNTYSGTTTVGPGATLVASSIGDGSTTNTLILNGGTFSATGNLTSPTARGIQISGVGSSLQTNANIVTLNGAVSGNGNWDKLGTGTLILAGTNTFTGAVSVNQGILNLRNNAALGASTAGVTVASGAALELENNITLANEPLSLAGTGIGGTGALRNVSGNNTFTGPITLAGATTLRAESGSSLTLGTIDLNGHNLTSSSPGILRSSGITGSGDITLNSNGTVEFLNGTHSFTGTVTITGSTLHSGNLNNANVSLNIGAFSPGGVGQLQHVTLHGISLNGGDLRFDLGNGSASDRILIGGGTATLTSHTVFNFNSVAYQPGTFTLLSGTGVDLLNPKDFSFTGTIPGLTGSFSVVGTDLLFTSVVATVSTWDGGAGTGSWDDANNWNPDGLPSPGNALIFSGNVQTTVDALINRTTGSITFDENASSFTIFGATLTVGGAITNQSGEVQTINSNLVFNHNGIINATSGNITLGGGLALSINTTGRTLTFTGSDTITVNGAIVNGSAATGNLLKTGNGTLTLNGANTYSGSTTLVGGIVEISNTNNLGNGSGTNTLIFNGGTLRLTADIPALAQNITLQSTGTLDTQTHNIGIGTVISGPGGLTKLGTGNLDLSAANTYEGLTQITSGTVTLANNHALGSTADGTLVEAGAALLLNNVSVGNETLLLNGGGITGTSGALQVNTGANSWAGTLLLGSSSLIAVNAPASLTVSGLVNLGTSTLSIQAGGLTTFSGPISGSGGLTKLGSDTLILTGNNTFSGTTTINNGTLQIGNGGTSGSLSGNITNNSLIIVNRSDSLVLPGIISGTGQLDQNGSGTLILTGTNTFSGTTTINNGTLQIGNGGTSGSLSSDIINNSALIFNRSDTLTYAGIISGTGSLTQEGSGTLILTGTNTYLGPTAINNGILRITNPGALSTGTITVSPGSVLELSNGITLPVTTTLNLAGTLQSNGGDNSFLANLILPGNATLSNLVAGTTFSLGSASFTESIDTGAGGFTLNLIGPGDILLNSAINGSGQVVKTGSGTVTYRADENFYTGPTTINEGTLILDTLPGLNGAIKSTLLTIGNNAGGPQSAIVQLGPTIAPTANEMINDTAEVRLFSDGLFRLNGQTETIGSLQFTGGTILTGTGGSLRFDPGTPAGGIITNASASAALIDATGGSIHLNGDRTFNVALGGSPADLEIRGPIIDGTASSSLTKQGEGLLLLTGNNTYTGNTNVLGGELQIEGSLASPTVTISNGATLGGSGTLLGSLVINAGGLLSPGSSPGILNVGSLTLAPGSTTLFEINGLNPGTQHDQVIAAGNASLAGTAQFLFGGGFTPSDGDTFTLIQAASITGTYDNFISNLGAIFGLDLLYNPTTFQLAIRVTQLDYTTFALNQNQFNVAANLDTFSRTGQMPELITLLNTLDRNGLSNALQQLSPDQLGVMNTLAKQYNRAQGRNLFNRLSEWRLSDGGIAGTVSTSSLRLLDWTSQPVIAGTKLREYTPVSLNSITSPGWSLFASGTGQFGDIAADGNGSGFDFNTAGMTIGLDRKITRIGDGDLIGGFYAGYAGSNAKLDGAGGRVETDGGKFGVFGSWIQEGLYVNAQAGGGVANYTTRRNVLGQRQTGETTGTEFLADLQLGHEWQKGAWRFGPELGLSYGYIGINRFTERGGLAPLQIQEQNNHSLQSRLGWQTSYEWTGKNDWWIRPAANFSWGHEFFDPNPSIDSRFASGAGGIFSVNPTEVGRDTAILGLTTTFGQGTRWSGWVGYEAEVGDRITVHTLNVGAAFKF
ncbi:MAG: hypothetical protein OHK005_12280 [Candidatus Methylacidiphilales bacterium]